MRSGVIGCLVMKCLTSTSLTFKNPHFCSRNAAVAAEMIIKSAHRIDLLALLTPGWPMFIAAVLVRGHNKTSKLSADSKDLCGQQFAINLTSVCHNMVTQGSVLM